MYSKKYFINYQFGGSLKEDQLSELMQKYDTIYQNISSQYSDLEYSTVKRKIKDLESSIRINNSSIERYNKKINDNDDVKFYQKLLVDKQKKKVDLEKELNEMNQKYIKEQQELEKLKSFGDIYLKGEYKHPELLELKKLISEQVKEITLDYPIENKKYNGDLLDLNIEQVNQILKDSTADFTPDYYINTITNYNQGIFESNNICVRNIKKYNIKRLLDIYNNNINRFTDIKNFCLISESFYEFYYKNYLDKKDLDLIISQELDPSILLKYNIDLAQINKDISNFRRRKKVIKYSLDLEDIPLGRYNIQHSHFDNNKVNYLMRDLNYYKNFIKIFNKLEKDNKLNNSLIINYTGHSSSFIIALLNKGIDFSIQFPKQIMKMSIWSILNQLQDSSNMVINKKITNDSSLGLVLESSHGLGELFDINYIPSLETIRKYGFERIIVITEDYYRPSIKDYTEEEREILSKGRHRLGEDEATNKLTQYLYEMMKHMPVEFYGSNERQSRYEPFNCDK